MMSTRACLAVLLSLLLIGWAATPSLYGQYQLHELGLSTGLGLDIPLGASRALPLPGLSLGGYYSHYACGKAYGYHAVLRLRAANVWEAAAEAGQGLRSPDAQRAASLHWLWLEPGIYFKVRGHKQHKARETAFLLGPLLAVRTFALSSGPAGELLGSDSWRSLAWVSPAVHFSAWIRRPLSRKAILFIQPGVDAHILPWLSNANRNLFTSLHPHLQLGLLLWDNK